MPEKICVLNRFLTNTESHAIIAWLNKGDRSRAIELLEKNPRRREILLVLIDILEALDCLRNSTEFNAAIVQVRFELMCSHVPWTSWNIASSLCAISYITTGRGFTTGEREVLRQNFQINELLIAWYCCPLSLWSRKNRTILQEELQRERSPRGAQSQLCAV